MKKALLVIDVQEIFLGESHAVFFDYDRELVNNINGIIEENKENMVVYIYNYMKQNFINKFAPYHVYENTHQAEPVKSLNIISGHKFAKYVGNAFSNPELDKFLKEKGVDMVEVVGVDGGGCVALTALSAVKKGYAVIVNDKGIGTIKANLGKKKKYDEQLKRLGAKFK